MTDRTILVAGAGGFIGGHLVGRLLQQGYTRIRAVDIKPLDEWFQVFDDVENHTADLKELEACDAACEGIENLPSPGFRHGVERVCRRRCPCHCRASYSYISIYQATGVRCSSKRVRWLAQVEAQVCGGGRSVSLQA